MLCTSVIQFLNDSFSFQISLFFKKMKIIFNIVTDSSAYNPYTNGLMLPT